MKKFIYISLCLFISINMFGQTEPSGKPAIDVDIKEILFGHVSNDYEFHIAAWGEHSIVVPLPVIVYSKDKGLNIFLSSRFEHKTGSYKGFEIAHDGRYKGQIVEKGSDGSYLRPWDFSITKNVFTILLACVLLCIVFIASAGKYKRNPNKAPSGLQSLLEPVVLFVTDDIAKPAIGEGYEKYTSYLLSVFFMILTLNLVGLIPFFPFGANTTGNINVTLALAICTFLVTMASTNKHYWIHKLWTPGVPAWLKVPVPLMPLVEMLSVITGPVALMIRLFANMLSGHMIVLALISMVFVFYSFGFAVDGPVTAVSVVFSVCILALDILVSFIQAYVFTLLSALYFGGARHP